MVFVCVCVCVCVCVSVSVYIYIYCSFDSFYFMFFNALIEMKIRNAALTTT